MKKSFRDSKWYSLILLSILAIIFVWQLSSSVINIFTIVTGEKIQGIVQTPTCSLGTHCSKRASLKIQYITPDGQTRMFEEFGGFAPYHPVGEQVTMYYSSESGRVAVLSLFNVVMPLVAIILLISIGWFMKKFLQERK